MQTNSIQSDPNLLNSYLFTPENLNTIKKIKNDINNLYINVKNHLFSPSQNTPPQHIENEVSKQITEKLEKISRKIDELNTLAKPQRDTENITLLNKSSTPPPSLTRDSSLPIELIKGLKIRFDQFVNEKNEQNKNKSEIVEEYLSKIIYEEIINKHQLETDIKDSGNDALLHSFLLAINDHPNSFTTSATNAAEERIRENNIQFGESAADLTRKRKNNQEESERLEKRITERQYTSPGYGCYDPDGEIHLTASIFEPELPDIVTTPVNFHNARNQFTQSAPK